MSDWDEEYIPHINAVLNMEYEMKILLMKVQMMHILSMSQIQQ